MELNKSSFQYMFALLLSVTMLFAQNITGTVSGDDGSALAGANVSVEGTDMGSASNTDGSFTISGLSDGTYTITASYIGYQDASAVVTISGGQASSANLTLEKSNLLLDQVVVSASFKKELVVDSPASVEVFDGAELEARGAASVVDVLANKAGVETMKMGVESSNMTVRGFNSVFSGAIHAVVDNRWTRAPVVNAQLLQFFSPDESEIDRLELVRGPATPMYGPDTQQGVIAIYTKSPFNTGNRVSLTTGDRDYMKVYARYSHQWGPRAATRVSLKHTTFTDWESNMPLTAAEASAAGHTYFEPSTIRRGLQTTVYPFVDYNTSYNDPVGGVTNTARDGYKPESTMLDMQTELRLDLKSTMKINARMANLSAIEMTGVGRQHADDATLNQFQVSYSRQDFLGGDLFVNFFTNTNKQETTYNVATGLIVYDTSSNRAFQLQHNIPLKNGQSVVWGVDFLDRTPETKGTINGQHEDMDDFQNVGAYYSYEKKWGDTFKFVGTGRVDSSNFTRDIGEDTLFAPKMALVWSPEAIRGSFRLTYGENIDLPGNFTKNLDIGVSTNFVYGGLNIDFQDPAFGGLPFNPDFQVKAMGSSTVGYTYHRDETGLQTFRSNWSPALGLDVNTNYGMNNNTINAAAHGVFAPLFTGQFLQSDQGAAYLQGVGAGIGANMATGLGAGLTLAQMGFSATVQGAFNQALAGGADVTTAVTTAASVAAALGAQDLMALAATALPTSFVNPVLNFSLEQINPLTDLPDSPVVKQTTWTQTEVGYKGQVSDNMTLTVDAYRLNVEGYVTNLQGVSGIVTSMGNAASYVSAIQTAMAGNTELTAFVSGWDAAAAGGNENGTGADEYAALILGNMAQTPMGAISPVNSPYGGNLIVGYKQLSEDLILHGLETTLNYFPNNNWNFFMNMSFLSDQILKADFEGAETQVEMNTPEFKLGAGFQFSEPGKAFGMNLRYQEGYDSNTGFATGRVAPFYTLGFNAKFDVDAVDGMSVGLSIDNVTDVKHKEMFLGPEMGRFTTLSIGYDL
tara:strand:- start:3905 stop:6985 length:3081 start_codon:yes stop_codon:yes gene_type:complete